MKSESNAIPVVLSIGSHDPSGASGLTADIEAIATLDCHCTPVVHTITVQNSMGTQKYAHCDLELVTEQAKAVMDDIPIAAFKISALYDVASVEAVSKLIKKLTSTPVIYDLELPSHNRQQAVPESLKKALLYDLLPHVSVCVGNLMEIRQLTSHGPHDESTSINECIDSIVKTGCQSVLVTGSQEATPVVHNHLFDSSGNCETYNWERLPALFHGASATLSAAIAALMAQGMGIQQAVEDAQEYTWAALAEGMALGNGQQTPNRFFWSRLLDEDDSVDEPH